MACVYEVSITMAAEQIPAYQGARPRRGGSGAAESASAAALDAADGDTGRGRLCVVWLEEHIALMLKIDGFVSADV